jgi:hypothetical protein
MKDAIQQLSNLVERFERNIEAYRSPAYNETQLPEIHGGGEEARTKTGVSGRRAYTESWGMVEGIIASGKGREAGTRFPGIREWGFC